jgi:hypothetical protein
MESRMTDEQKFAQTIIDELMRKIEPVLTEAVKEYAIYGKAQITLSKEPEPTELEKVALARAEQVNGEVSFPEIFQDCFIDGAKWLAKRFGYTTHGEIYGTTAAREHSLETLDFATIQIIELLNKLTKTRE